MRVLQISTPFLPVSSNLRYGGSERIVYLLDKELNLRGLSAGVVAPRDSTPESYLYPTISKSLGVDGILDKSQNSEFMGFAVRAEHLAQSIKYANELKDMDIVHIHDDNILPFDFLLNKPSLITLHSDIDSFWDLSLTPSLKDKKSKFVSISQNQKKIQEARGHKVDYAVYNGVEENKFSISNSIQNYLLTLGSIQPVKGQHNAIEVAKKTGFDLIIAGNIGNKNYFDEKISPNITYDLSKEEDKLEEYLSIKSSSQKLVYVGPVTDEQKAPLYSYAKAFLMPIEWEEPFGLVMVESMMSGTPVIAFNRGSIPEIVQEGTGYIVNNLEEMVEAVKNIDCFDREKIREKAIDKFGKKQMVDNYIKVYQDILNQKD